MINYISTKIKNYQKGVEASRKLKKNTPVYIFTMGKVASNSIKKSLLSQYDSLILLSHFFHKDSEFVEFKALYKHIKIDKKPVKIITMVREPIGRNLSAFFYWNRFYTMAKPKDYSFTTKEFTDFFIDNYEHDVALHWFDYHIKRNFGIDLYASEFDTSKKYCIHEKDNISLLTMRTDLDNEIKQQLVKEFVGLEKFKLTNANTGAEKEYAATYKKFKNEVLLPESYLVEMSQSKYFKHFYSSAEIEAILKKWRKN